MRILHPGSVSGTSLPRSGFNPPFLRSDPHPCRESPFSWINRCRRTVRDYERRQDHHAAMVQWAMIIIMARRLARHHAPARTPSTA